MPPLYRLVLFGRASKARSALGLDLFLEESRDRAARLHVTGSVMVVHDGGRPTAYVVWAEGPSDGVLEVERAFAELPFLEGTRVLVRSSPAARSYASWGVTRTHAEWGRVETALERFAPHARGPRGAGTP